MGLFPCSLIARTRSVLISVALGLCVAAHGGSKIEFSVPDTEIEVPDWQKELKQDTKNALKSDLDFKGSGINVAPQMPAQVYVARPQDPFSKDKDKDKDKNGRMPRPEELNANQNLSPEQYKAAKAAQEMRSGTDETISSQSWEVNRRSGLGREEHDSQSRYNPNERSVGWSTLFKEAQDERDRKEQTARLNDFKALYGTPSSMSPVGTPSPDSDPFKQSLLHDAQMNSRDNRNDFMSRRDDSQYNQFSPAQRNTEESYNAGAARADFNRSAIAPIREFEKHRGVLEMPKRPGDLLK